MADYNSSYTGPQIDEAVGKALTPDATPTENSTELVQSGGAYADVRTRVPNYGKGKNLLRNWYFVGGGTGRGVFPVNQRGFASSSGINNIYSIDGWYINGGRGEQALQSNGFYINNNSGTGNLTVQQSIDMRATDYKGKSVTLSVLVDGYLYHESKTVPQQSSSLQIVIDLSLSGTYCRLYLLATDSSTPFVVQFLAGNSRTALIQAVKLELGTEQTLVHQENGVWVLNEIPDYEYELYRCITSTADPSDTYANKSLATEQQIAYVETGTTASRAYTVGEYFCWNGLLYRVKTAISSGGTFTPGTNCEQAVEGGFNNLIRLISHSIVTQSSYTINALHFELLSNRLMVVSFSITCATASSSSINIGGVPSGYRPSSDLQIVVPALSGNTLNFRVRQNGYVNAWGGTAGQIYNGTMTYVIP